MRNNLIAIANNFVKVRDITNAERGTWILSLGQWLARLGRQSFGTSDESTEWLAWNAYDLYVYRALLPPQAPFEEGDAYAAVFWRGNDRC